LRPCHADETTVSDDRLDEEGGVRMSGEPGRAVTGGVGMTPHQKPEYDTEPFSGYLTRPFVARSAPIMSGESDLAQPRRMKRFSAVVMQV
jgi:hypothetical protein